MAVLIYDVKVKMGRVIAVQNTERKPTEVEEFVAVKVEGVSGKQDTEQCILFTQKEFDALPIYDFNGLEMKAGRLYPFADTQHEGYLVLFMEYNAHKKEWYKVVRRITEKRLKRAEQRAADNPEDLVVVPWYEDLLD